MDAALAKLLARSATHAKATDATNATNTTKATNVVDLAARRAARAWWSVNPQVAVAAMVLLFVGGAGAWKTAHRMPAGTVAYRTLVPPPTPLQLANFARRQALASCEAEYYGEAEDLLDAAAKDDPTSEDRDDVKACRKAIDDHDNHRTRHRRGGFDAKLPVAPNERPLRPLLKERPLQPLP